jgi:hypothetical protein
MMVGSAKSIPKKPQKCQLVTLRQQSVIQV